MNGPSPRIASRRVTDFRDGSRYLSRAVAPTLDGAWIVRDWIPARGLTVLYGASGVGKSHLAVDLAAHVAGGRAWAGEPVEAGFVAYLALEGRGSLDNRIVAVASTFGDAPVWFAVAPFGLGDPNAIGALIATISAEAASARLPVRAVFVDTLARAMGALDENSNRDVSLAVGALERIGAELNCAVVAVHHSGKDATKGERGGSALRAAAEAVVEVSAEGAGAAKVVTASVRKERDGPGDGAFSFRLRPVRLGEDRWGREVSCCVVAPLDAGEAELRQTVSARARLTPRQRDALEALRDAAERHGRRIVGSPDYPPSRLVVSEDPWRSEFYARAFTADDSAETKRKAFQRVRLDLRQRGLVGQYGGQFWVVYEDDRAGHGRDKTGHVPPRPADGDGTGRDTHL